MIVVNNHNFAGLCKFTVDFFFVFSFSLGGHYYSNYVRIHLDLIRIKILLQRCVVVLHIIIIWIRFFLQLSLSAIGKVLASELPKLGNANCSVLYPASTKASNDIGIFFSYTHENYFPLDNAVTLMFVYFFIVLFFLKKLEVKHPLLFSP